MRVLGIETSCDETAASVVDDGRFIRSSVVASQAAAHAAFGGIVPEVASRAHVEAIGSVVRAALAQADAPLASCDAIAVTVGPGLPGSLLVGVSFAKSLAFASGLPLIPVNHVVAHAYAAWLCPQQVRFPALALIVSGAHADLALMRGHGRFERLARTRDDAPGEAFDKVARLLGLGYPGGPAIQAAAIDGDPMKALLPRLGIKDSLDYSFSGLKTAVLRLTQASPAPEVRNIAASFQSAAVDALARSAQLADDDLNPLSFILAGGVAANTLLRARMDSLFGPRLIVPPVPLCTDNAAMVAVAGHFAAESGIRSGADLDTAPSLRIGDGFGVS